MAEPSPAGKVTRWVKVALTWDGGCASLCQPSRPPGPPRAGSCLWHPVTRGKRCSSAALPGVTPLRPGHLRLPIPASVSAYTLGPVQIGAGCDVKTPAPGDPSVWLGLGIEELLTVYPVSLSSPSLSLPLPLSPLTAIGLSMAVSTVFVPCLLHVSQILGLAPGPGRGLG